MKCVCCLLDSQDKRKLSRVTAADRKFYNELTRIEMKNSNSRICLECRKTLRISTEFLKMCIISNQSIHETFKEAVREKRSSRSRLKLTENLSEEQTDSFRGEANEDDSTCMDASIDIQSVLNEKFDVEEESPPALTEPVLPEAIAENYTPSDKLPQRVLKFKCSDCEKMFATKFRLQAHRRKL